VEHSYHCDVKGKYWNQTGVCEQFHAEQTTAYPMDSKHVDHSVDEQKIRLEIFTAFTVNSTSLLGRDVV
jgi:hypothetical protein